MRTTPIRGCAVTKMRTTRAPLRASAVDQLRDSRLHFYDSGTQEESIVAIQHLDVYFRIRHRIFVEFAFGMPEPRRAVMALTVYAVGSPSNSGPTAD
jgi:hypothetical protein